MLNPLRKTMLGKKKTEDEIAIEAREEVIMRRSAFLKALGSNPTTLAQCAAVSIAGLPDYYAALRGLGLTDARDRLSVAGAAYRVLVEYAATAVRQGDARWLFDVHVPRKSIWSRVGGTEEAFNKALETLRFSDLVAEDADDAYVVL
uniref:Uncharacterized protein n=1 Tax=Caulobacter phage BL57 TaxID=3348355 RepID=A0AB74UMJ8_9VIRU